MEVCLVCLVKWGEQAAALLHIALSVAEGCEFLETRHVVHRKLQTANVLVGDTHREVRIAVGLDTARDVSRSEEYIKVGDQASILCRMHGLNFPLYHPVWQCYITLCGSVPRGWTRILAR